MRPERLRTLLLKEKPWDLIASARTMADMDIEAIKTFQRRVIDSGRLKDVSLEDDPEIFLEKLEALAEHRPTNGALMLFGKDPQRHFMNASVRLGRFKSETDIIDDKWAKGNLFNQFEEALKLIMQHISVRYEITAPERKDIWDYPLPVLREAILNAIIHRDYHDIANFIQIKVYDDRIWISNPGGLPEGLTIEELRKPHKSHVRNPLIAKAFYLSGFIEQFGSGTIRMINGMKQAGLQEPDFKEEMGGFSVYLRKSTSPDSGFLAAGLNERQVKAVIFARKNGRINNQEYRQLTGVGRRLASEELTSLQAKGILIRIGKTGKGTYYTLHAGI
jgi:ATP-dependent DNA helicase RecG